MGRSTSSQLRATSHTVLAAALWLLVARPARAEPMTYRPAPAPEGSASARIDLPYTFGTHNFDARLLQGEVHVDWKRTPAVGGRLTLPLSSIHGGGETLNCHMREAMGLDYARSAFPGKHVCEGGKLPATGNDAVAFPDIAFEIQRVVVDPVHTRSGEYEIWRTTAYGRWTIHGVTRDASIDLHLTVPANQTAHPSWVRVEGGRRLRLADYGIQVKRAFVVTAGDEATIKLDVLLRAQ